MYGGVVTSNSFVNAVLVISVKSFGDSTSFDNLLFFFSRSYGNRSLEHRPFDRRCWEGYRRLEHSRDRDREREPHGVAESYYQRDFSPDMYDYRRGRERDREREESYRRKGSRRKHKRRRRRTRSYSPSSSVSTA